MDGTTGPRLDYAVVGSLSILNASMSMTLQPKRHMANRPREASGRLLAVANRCRFEADVPFPNVAETVCRLVQWHEDRWALDIAGSERVEASGRS